MLKGPAEAAEVNLQHSGLRRKLNSLSPATDLTLQAMLFAIRQKLCQLGAWGLLKRLSGQGVDAQLTESCLDKQFYAPWSGCRNELRKYLWITGMLAITDLECRVAIQREDYQSCARH